MRVLAAALVACGVAQAELAMPSPEQLAWHGFGVGAIIHFNLQTLCVQEQADPRASTQRCQKLGWVPKVEEVHKWDPDKLDTDAWVETAMSFGAKYIVLVAGHMTGFTLWDTQVHNFSIAHTAWRGGGGDVVRDFVASCRKYGVKPGLFYSTHFNWYLGVNEYEVGFPALGGVSYTQDEYDEIVVRQLKELLTGYGDIAEIWFDGGIRADKTPRAVAAVREYGPRVLCHSCQDFPRDLAIRWMGNEAGVMPLPSWGASTGDVNGDPASPVYMPPSADTVLREHYWFWYPGSERFLKRTSLLLSNYLTSTGRSANLMLNIGPDDTGAIQDTDVAAYKALGDAVTCLFATEVYTSSEPRALTSANNYTATWSLDTALTPRNVTVTLQEDITRGQAIGRYTLAFRSSSAPTAPPVVFDGESIGYNMIINVALPAAFRADTMILTATQVYAAAAAMRGVKLHDWEGKERCGH